MQNTTLRNILLVLILTLVVPILMGNIFTYYFSSQYQNIPFHTAIEVSGGLIAIVIAMIIHIKFAKKSELNLLIYSSYGLLIMGILDIFHGIMSPGEVFVWLHSISVFLGGMIFIFIWNKSKKVSTLEFKLIPQMIILGAIVLSIGSILFPSIVPQMLDENNNFTQSANFLNIVGGVGFFIASIKFILDYKKSAEIESLLFAGLTLLFGIAGIFFVQSTLWDINWWLWHILRLLAYTIAFYFLYVEFTKEIDHIELSNMKIKEHMDIINKNVITSETNLRGKITSVSDAFCQVSGYDRDELIGKTHNIVRHPDMKKELFDEIWKTIEQNKTWEGEIKNINKYGHHYWVYATIMPRYDIDGVKIGYFSTRLDISAKKDYEKQQEVLLEQTKLASMGEMLENIAHQWRQPLSAISISATGALYAKDTGVLSDQLLEKNLNTINDQAQYLSKTIDTFRNFLLKNNEPINTSIEDEIKSAKFIVEPSFKSHDINIVDRVDYGKKHSIIMVPNELSQVILNILNNAKDALKEKDPLDDKELVIDLESDNKKVLIKIEDNGGGIPLDIIGKIFEPYFTTKHKSQGTGLGLHMSYKIIKENLNGDIRAYNTKKGAQFIIELPSNDKT